jgi:hypothetical protein
MSFNLGQKTRKIARVRNMFVTTLVLGSTFGMATFAQRVTPPTTPDAITPPDGNTAFLLGRGVGTQGYVCLPTSVGASTASWTVNNARPEATLFTKFLGKDVEIITHFLSPDENPNANAPNPVAFGNATWQSSLDSSKVWAQSLFSEGGSLPVQHAIPAGSDPSCSNSGAISCLLLQSIGTEKGPAGGNFLTQTSFIQRLNTKGGSAPDTGCSAANDVGKQVLVPYSADYYFYHATE